MARLIRLQDGRIAGLAVCEITAIPYFELLHADPDRACQQNQALFNQILTTYYMNAEKELTALELLWQSTPVSNQTYAAQVRQYLLLRRIGDTEDEVKTALEQQLAQITNELRGKEFEIADLDDGEIDALAGRLRPAEAGGVAAVARKENYLPNAYGGGLYYNDAITPSENLNMTELSNALTNYPDCAVSLQLIPTSYEGVEIMSNQQGRAMINSLITNIHIQQGIRADANLQRALSSFESRVQSEREPLFYFNFLAFGSGGSAVSLANKVISAMEQEGNLNGSALNVMDLSGWGISLTASMELSPWLNSNILVFEARDREFWGHEMAPQQMIRMRYLATAQDLSGVFKLPIDDGHAIGLISRRIATNREQLNKSIIAEGNFKVGVIANATRTAVGEEAHAGVPLKDFTKHMLVVGMPGSGKTYFSLGFLLQMYRSGIPFLAIEPTKSEYRTLLDAIDDLQVFTPGKTNVSPFIINPFLPPPGVTVETFVPSLISAFRAAFSMPDPLPSLFQEAVNECYAAYGWRTDSMAGDPHVKVFGMYEFIQIFRRQLEHKKYDPNVRSNMQTAGMVRLMSLIEQNANMYDTVNSIPLLDLLTRPTIIELNAISDEEQKSLVMALLLIQVCTYTKNNIASDGELKNILLIDEAHVLLGQRGGPQSQGGADAGGSTVKALENMILELRSYGTGIVIADQSPTAVGRVIVANTNVKVIFRLIEKENKDIIRETTGMSDADYESMGRLGVGEAILHLGRLSAPLHIKTYDLSKTVTLRKEIKDAEVHEKCRYWDSHAELLVPYRECAYNSCCCGSCDIKLRTDADFIARRLVGECVLGLDEKDKRSFIKFLVNMDKKIDWKLKELPDVEDSLRLRNCVKIKVLRRSMLQKSFGFTEREYETILGHKNFLKSESTAE